MEKNVDKFSFIKIQNFSSGMDAVRYKGHRLKRNTLMHIITNKGFLSRKIIIKVSMVNK